MNGEQSKVLVVEDDTALRRSLRSTLSIVGFDIGEAGNGEEALMRLRMVDFAAVLLDINMPGMGGMETCSRIRGSFTRLPILMLTVRGNEDDKVQALESGADDYITKPFQVRELTARLRAAVRRYHAPEVPAELPIHIRDIVLDPVRHEVQKAGVRIHLTPHEFDALKLLMSNSGRPVPHARFHAVLRPSDVISDRAYLRVLVRQLRKKLGDDSNSPTYIETDGYFGYRFRDSYYHTGS
jgi:two-component system KDP operon response regulator KdpE